MRKMQRKINNFDFKVTNIYRAARKQQSRIRRNSGNSSRISLGLNLALGQEVVVESFEDGSKIVLVDLVEEQVFAKACDREDGNQELCNPTGRMLVEANGDWWYEYEDSLGGLHYGR